MSRLTGTAGLAPRHANHPDRAGLVGPLLLLACLAALYVPTVITLSGNLWRDSTHSHGPIVLAVVVWLMARGIRHQLSLTPATAPLTTQPALGMGLLVFGALIYVLGRSQALMVLEVGSAIPVSLGLILLVLGRTFARALWFPLLFMLFLVPLPGSLVDAITHPMKLAVSWASEGALGMLGYPVARAGVILTIGQYQMFVADACAGLTSLFMLEAFGLLYLNVVRHASALRNLIVGLLIIPISFIANVLRVISLCLVTYHFGDAAGQGFVHDFSGIVLFTAALALTVAGDTFARGVAAAHRKARGMPAAPEGPEGPGAWPEVTSWAPVRFPAARGAIGLALALTAVGAAALLTPRPIANQGAGNLEAMIPRQFGEWTIIDRPSIPVDVLANEPGETTLHSPYDQVVMRVYRHSSGAIVDLAVAYGKHQRQEVKIHQPELCFNSQGFRVKERRGTEFKRPQGDGGPAITGINLYSEGNMAKLAASYWIRIGKVYSDSAWETRWEIFREGLSGRAVDGVLVRATVQVPSQEATGEAYPMMERFLADLLVHGSPELRRALAP
jgi:exosortase B